MKQGQVKQHVRWGTVTCAGLQFNKKSWVAIPEAKVEECEQNPLVEVREVEIEAAPAPAAVDPRGDAADESQPKGPEAELLEGNVGQVGAKVRAIDDVELLEAAMAADTRVGVKKAIKARLEELAAVDPGGDAG